MEDKCPCNPEDQTVVEVTYKDNSKHLKGTCGKCGKSKWLRRPKSKETLKNISVQLKTKYGNSFYTEPEWLEVRYKVLSMSERICALCGSNEKPLHVDHIKPRSKYPDLELDITNLQILCWRCNKGKGNKDEQDFRGAT